MDKCHIIKVDKKNCICRLWNKGLSSQCKSYKIKDKQYCKSHYEKTNNGKELWGFGLITDKELPKKHLSDYPEKKGKSLPWKVEIKNFNDNEIILNQLMPREIQKTNRKCSICGKPGHNKRKCPEINSQKAETVPKKEETVPKNEETVPKKEETVPKKEETVPKKEETVPKKEETVPKKEETDIYMEPYMISYQGVSYIYSEKNGGKHIINSKTEIVGLWNNGEIQWNDKKYEIEHNNSK
jgi:hypothetical protein